MTLSLVGVPIGTQVVISAKVFHFLLNLLVCPCGYTSAKVQQEAIK